MCRTIITNGTIVNDGEHFIGSIIVKGEFIESVIKGKLPENIVCNTDRIIDASGKWILPGVIDDQVHFREPGLTHKAEIATESVAAVAGGITSFMEMPNTVPQTTTLEALEWKYSRAAEVSPANYSFYIGATNDNFEVLKQVDFSQVCGVKIFMGSSTGNMLVDSEKHYDESSPKFLRSSPYIANKNPLYKLTKSIIPNASERIYPFSSTLLSAVPRPAIHLRPKPWN